MSQVPQASHHIRTASDDHLTQASITGHSETSGHGCHQNGTLEALEPSFQRSQILEGSDCRFNGFLKARASTISSQNSGMSEPRILATYVAIQRTTTTSNKPSKTCPTTLKRLKASLRLSVRYCSLLISLIAIALTIFNQDLGQPLTGSKAAATEAAQLPGKATGVNIRLHSRSADLDGSAKAMANAELHIKNA